MRAVMWTVPPDIAAWRKRTGADQWDERWDGVLQLMPAPTPEHQDLEGSLEAYLRWHWARSGGGKVLHQINLSLPEEWPDNYRIPDLLLMTPDRFAIVRDTHYEGAPSAVVEIHSPDVDTYEKLPFYEELGVPETWIIHRDSKEVEIYLLRKGRYRKKRAVSGWVRSPLTGLELRPDGTGKLLIRRQGDPSTEARLPER